MPPRHARAVLVLLCLATPAPAAALQACLDLETATARLRCVESRVADGPVPDADFDSLVAAVPGLPGHADLVLAVLERDDGTVRVSWRREDGETVWERSVASGERLARGARAVVDAGEPERARPWIERLIGLGERGWAVDAWRARDWGPLPGSDGGARPLEATEWLRPLPDLGVDLFDGGRFEFADARGKVLILDFWATWCPPCLDELPHLQHLVNELADQGLAAVAINSGESRDVAMGLADQIGLTLPVGAHSRELDRFFRVGALPTVILVDRDGRIRQRWSGFGPGGEKPIADLARRVVAGEPPPRATVAEVSRGSGRFRAEWTKPGQTQIDGLTVLRMADGPDRVAVSRRNGQLTVIDGSGVPVHSVSGFFASALRSADLTGDGYAEVVGFSPGGTELEIVDLRGESRVTRSLTAPLFDMLPLAAGADDRAGLLVAATDGVYRLGPTGERPRRVEGVDAAYAIASTGNAGIRVLDGDGSIRRIATSGVDPEAAPRGAWRLIASDGEWGIAPSQVLSAAVGRFAAGRAATLALALDDGQLLLLDTADGSTELRARWEGLRQVAAGDLDGDGTDELVVAAGRQVTVLEGVAGDRGNVP
jgi:thiol-disulfide isomerase/thioredoxin